MRGRWYGRLPFRKCREARRVAPLISESNGSMTAMAKRVGRPSKGDRHTFMTRVPRAAADLIQEEAHRRGTSYSEYIAYVLATAHGVDMPEPTASTDYEQKELDLQNVS